MTDHDTSDTGQHEAGADHEPAMTGEHETWTGEPPVDDFHAGEEAATVSEETDHPETGEAVMAGEVAKKSLALPIIAGIGGLLFLGAVLYWQFHNNAATAPMPAASIPPLSNPMPPQATAANIPTPAAMPSAMPAAPNAGPMPTAPAAEVAPTTALEAPADKNLPTAAPTVVMPPKPPADAALAPTATPSMPVAAAPAVVTPPAAAMAPTMAPMAAAPTPTAAPPANNSLDARLSLLSAHVDDLQRSLTQATQQLSQVTAKLSASAPSSTEADSTIDDRLNKIEQKLMQMQHGTSSHVTAVADEGAVAVPEKTSAHKHMHKAVYKKASYMKVKKPAHKFVKATVLPKAQPAATTNWVLRAATPDEAWVATNASTPELRHVQVGDNLAGIGQVRAIHQNGDNWVIEGTEGTVQ